MENVKDFLPYFIPIMLGLLTWFYTLTEKRINARAEENDILNEKVHRLELRVVKLESEQFTLSIAVGNMKKDLKEHIDFRMDNLEAILKAKGI